MRYHPLSNETVSEEAAWWRGQAAGIPPKDILTALVPNAARLLGVEKQRGAISAGQFADIIATPDNPLDNIMTLKQVNFVMKNGKVFKGAK